MATKRQRLHPVHGIGTWRWAAGPPADQSEVPEQGTVLQVASYEPRRAVEASDVVNSPKIAGVLDHTRANLKTRGGTVCPATGGLVEARVSGAGSAGAELITDGAGGFMDKGAEATPHVHAVALAEWGEAGLIPVQLKQIEL